VSAADLQRQHGSQGPGRGGPAKGAGHEPDCNCARCVGFQPGNAAGLRHGATSEHRIRPLARNHRRRVLRQIGLRASEVDPIGRAHLELLCRATSKIELLDRYVDEHGLVRPDGTLQPCMRVYPTLLNTARASLNALARHLRSTRPEDAFDFAEALNALGRAG
jgi:hypothetical protein